MSPLEQNNSMEMSQPTEKTTKTVTTLKDYRQKLMATHACIKYRERTIKGFKNHLKKGTFPQRMKSIKPYPKMSSSESQAIVNAACDQVQCVILDQMIQEEEKKLVEDQDQYQTLKVQRDSTCHSPFKFRVTGGFNCSTSCERHAILVVDLIANFCSPFSFCLL